MAVVGSSLSVTTAVALNTAGSAQRITVSNGSGSILYLGGSNVDATHGIAIAVSTVSPTFIIGPGEVLYAFAASATTVGVLVSGA